MLSESIEPQELQLAQVEWAKKFSAEGPFDVQKYVKFSSRNFKAENEVIQSAIEAARPLADKIDDIDEMKASEINADNMQRVVNNAKEQVSVSLANMAKDVSKSLSLPIYNRQIAREKYLGRVLDSENKAIQFRSTVASAVLLNVKGHRKEENQGRMRQKKLKKEKLTSELRLKALKDSNDKNVLAQEEDYKQRQHEIAETKSSALSESVQRKELELENEQRDTRQWRVKYWGDNLIKFREEAVEARKTQIFLRKQTFLDSMIRDDNDWKIRDTDRIRFQSEGPQIDPSTTLGVYGNETTPADLVKSDYKGIIHSVEDRMMKPVGDLDMITDKTPSLFTSKLQSTEYESKLAVLYDLQADLKRDEDLYSSLIVERSSFGDQCKTVEEVLRKIKLDMSQIRSENDVLQRKLIGPPHREAARSEKLEGHEHQIHLKTLQEQADQLDAKLYLLKEKASTIDSQTNRLSADIAIKRERNKESQSEIDVWVLPIGNVAEADTINAPLPAIVGRSLQKVPSIASSMMHNPKELYFDVLHQSKVEVMKDQASQILESYKQSKSVESDMWMLESQSRDNEALMQESISKAAQMTVRIKQINHERTRKDMVSSVESFYSASYTLSTIEVHHKGPLAWWLLKDKYLTRNVERWYGYNRAPNKEKSDESSSMLDDEDDSNIPIHLMSKSELSTFGVRLGDSKAGFVMGSVKMPKCSIWKVTMSIGRVGPAIAEAYDTQSRVVVKLGPSLETLSTISTIFNIRNPSTGLFRYDLDYEFRGDSMAFRFEFVSSNPDRESHMGIICGTYEEVKIPALVDVRKGPNKKSVLSSLIVEQRIIDKQAKTRMESLLLALIDVEESNIPKHHDSSSITGYRQRFRKKDFKKLIRAEVFMQLRAELEEASRRETKKKSKALTLRPLLEDSISVGSSRTVSIHDEVEKQSKKDKFLSSSEAGCKKRLRNKHKIYIDNCYRLVGKRIEILGRDKLSWNHAVIVSCQTFWRDGGTVPDVHHQVQMLDEGLNSVGECEDVILKNRKYYEASDTKQDAVLVNRWKESEKIKTLISDIEKKAFEKVEKICKSLEESQINALKQFDDDEHNDKSSQAIIYVQEADSISISNTVQSDIERQVNENLLQSRFNQASVDEKRMEMKRNLTEKWKQDHIASKTAKLEDEWNARRIAMNKLHGTEKLKLEADCKMALRVSQERKELILEEDQRKKQDIRQSKINSLQIEGFSKAVPTAHCCEHIHTKHWGNNYGKGVRCLDCGKELTTIHDDRNQELGYGTGGNAKLDAEVMQHRENESEFRCTDYKQRAAIEKERIRLEKERREIEEQEIRFYDLPDILPNYQFDVRHHRELKASGVMRESVQWSLEELKKYIDDRRQKEIAEAESHGLLACAIEKSIDPLHGIEDPAPTFRAVDERHMMQNRELLRTMARMSQYEYKLSEMKGIRVILLAEKITISTKLDSLHSELRFIEFTLTDIESEMDRVREMLAVKKQMDVLWKSANDILHQAEVSFKKAEMKRAGKREQAAECDVKVGKIIEESKDVCKQEFLLCEELRIVERAVNGIQADDINAWTNFSDAQSDYHESCYKVRGRLVATPFGQLRVRRCRESDQMLMFFLPFCYGRATLYVPLKKIVAYERSLQRSEQQMMDHEDKIMKKLTVFELLSSTREKNQMKSEDDLSKRLRSQQIWVDWENSQINESVVEAANKASDFVILPIFRIQGRVEAEMRVMEEMRKKEVEIKAFKGSGKRPKQMSRWKRYRRVKELVSDIASEFVQKTAVEASHQKKKELGFISHWKSEQDVMEILVDLVVGEEISNITKETIEEGILAKKKAEEDSGIYFPHPSNMQYSVYYQLRESWKDRKRNLKRELMLHGSKTAKMMQSMQEENQTAEEYADMMRQKEIEAANRKTQMGFAILMAQEDARMKDFLRQELSLCLEERRQMQQEDQLCVAFRAMMKVRSRKPGKTSNSRKSLEDMESESDEEEDQAATIYHVRRIQIKRSLHSRRQLAKERRCMLIEDDLSRELRYSNTNAHKGRINLKNVILSNKVDTSYISSDESSLCSDDDPSKQDWTVESMNDDISEKKKPKISKRRSLIIGGKKTDISKVAKPRHWDSLTDGQKINWERMARHEERETMRRTKTEWTKIAKEVAIEKTEAINWMRDMEVRRLETLEAEIFWMETDERRNSVEGRLVKLRENIRKIRLYSQQKGLEEARTTEEAKRMWLLADHCDAEFKEALDWLEACRWRSKSRSKVKRRVDELCGWSDTTSITGFHQRWETPRLLTRLQQLYVETNVRSIINRAELVAVERRSQGISELLSLNSMTLISKSFQMGQAWREHQINELCRLKRSELTKRLFKNSCHKMLIQAWSGWTKYHLWYKGCKMAFELRYNLVKNELDIKRMWKEKMDADQSFEYITSEPRADIPVTHLQRHHNRPIECGNCSKFFLESQNHSMICRYHSESFKLACPRSCTGLSPKCMSHRRRRWTCCDKTEEGSKGSNGCMSRYHVAVAVDPIYDRMIASITVKETTTEQDLDIELAQYAGKDVQRELYNAKREQLEKTEGFMKHERDVVASFDKIKFV